MFPYGLRDMGSGMIELRLLTLNEYGCRITDILTRSRYNSGWCIIGRQTIWWKRRLALDIMRPICVGWVSQVPLSNSTRSNNYIKVDLHRLPHAHHGFHHRGHLLFHGLHIDLHMLMYLFYATHYLSLGTSLAWVS